MTCGQSRSDFLRRQLSLLLDDPAPTIVGDAAIFRDWARACDLLYLPINSAAEVPNGSFIIFCATKAYYRQLNKLRDIFARSRVLWMPFAAFHDDTGPVVYGLEKLMMADFCSVRANQIATADLLRKHRQILLTDRHGGTITCRIPDSSVIAQAPRGKLRSGDFISLISYFEVETEYASTESELLAADGALSIDCLLFASSARRDVDVQSLTQAQDLCTQVGNAKETILVLAEGKLKSLTVDGHEKVETLTAMAGERLGAQVTELSIGLNGNLGCPDWQLNSPMNEGARGVHLGIGDGYSGLHFDFVSSAAAFAPTSQQRPNLTDTGGYCPLPKQAWF